MLRGFLSKLTVTTKLQTFSLNDKKDFQEWVYDEINHYPSVEKYLKGNSPDDDKLVVLFKEIVAGSPISDLKELLYFCDLAYRRIEANETWGAFDYSPKISPFPVNVIPHFQHLLAGHISAFWVYCFEGVTFPSFYPRTLIGKHFLGQFENGFPTIAEAIEWTKSNDVPLPADSRIKTGVVMGNPLKVKCTKSSRGFGN